MKIILRNEEENDYNIVEELTREAFWNVYVPGCDEHLLIHNLRKAKEFISALDIVAVLDNQIVGNIVYAEAKVFDADKEHIVLTFGPLSVLPAYQNKGIGAQLIEYTIQLAKEMRYKAIIIYGDPDYYKRFGFKASKEYNITNKEKKYPVSLLVLELYQSALNEIRGIFDEGKVYEIDQKEFKEFEKRFPPKEKLITNTQNKFKEIIKSYL